VGRSATTIARYIGKGLSLLAACFLALALGGCGGIEFQGKAFDYMGLSDVGKQKEDVRMTERAPLLVPPNVKSLPPPGSPAVTRTDWPADTDKERKRLAALRKAEEEKKAAELDPDNPYAGKPKLLDKLLGKSKSKEEGETVDVPEPDPADKTAEDKARERTATTSATQKPVDQSLNAPTPPADPFHPSAPDSYTGMSNPSGNNANY
jgi:hypothetical protein